MSESVQILLTVEQQVAVDAAVRCLSGEGKETLTIGGLAGVGKSILVKHILEEMHTRGASIAVTAFAGKACDVLRRKGVWSAQTLHSLIYKPDKENGKLVFRKVMDLEVDGVIVDEASMINTALHADLLSFGIPVVFIGDHGQLEPIGDNPRIMERPDIRLEKIHRQAEGSAILWLAHLFREGKKPNWATVKSDEIRAVTKTEALRTCDQYDAVICGFNKTRIATNSRVRKNKGFFGQLVQSERLICIKNCRYGGFFNGMMFSVEKIHGEKDVWGASGPVKCFEVDIRTDDGNLREKIYVRFPADDNELKDYTPRSDYVVVDYGYCLTAHKVQGSQFKKVLVIEETWDKWDWKRWSYTCATRAEKELAWVKK